LFFEQDHVTLCHVYPALKDIKKYLVEQHTIYHPSTDEVHITITNSMEFLLDSIRARRKKLLDRDLLKAAFWRASFGCLWANGDETRLTAPYRLVL
jgi:hypothetical protein